MAAAGLAPDEFAGADGKAFGRAVLVDELAFEHVSLLDLDVLMVGQRGAGRESHQRGDEPGLLVEQQALDLAAGKSRLLPFHLGRAHHVRMRIGRVVLGLWRDGVHGVLLDWVWPHYSRMRGLRTTSRRRGSAAGRRARCPMESRSRGPAQLRSGKCRPGAGPLVWR